MPTPPDMWRIGVILAAGRGRRMGRTKQLVEWQAANGPQPLVAAAFDAIRPICDEMVVVVGHEADAVVAALGDRPFYCATSDPDAPMFESIRAGLSVAVRELNPFAIVLLQPGDHPEVSPATLRALVRRAAPPTSTAIVPEYNGRGGHPVMIPPGIAELLLGADCPGGLGQFWSDHPELCERLPVEDPTILRDLDTPGDLLQ